MADVFHNSTRLCLGRGNISSYERFIRTSLPYSALRSGPRQITLEWSANRKRACGKCEQRLRIIDHQKIRPPDTTNPKNSFCLSASMTPVRCGWVCVREVC